MKTFWMDFFSNRTSNAAHGSAAVHQTGRWDRLSFWPREQAVA